jgi:hypothetical protein
MKIKIALFLLNTAFAITIQIQNCYGKPAFNKKRALSTSKIDLELGNKLVKCYI